MIIFSGPLDLCGLFTNILRGHEIALMPVIESNKYR